MPSSDENSQEQWPEHAVCARCAAPLSDAYQVSPLGLRFCKDCFDGAIQEKVKERAAALFLKGRCANCGRSLINGYRMNQFGVLYCLTCAESSQPSRPKMVEEEPPDVQQTEKGHAFPVDMFLIGSVLIPHLLFFADFLLSGHFFHGKTFFRPLVSLDLLALLLLAIARRTMPSRLQFWLTLLLATAFTILVVEQVRWLFS